jgi:hypothetical protein
VANGLDTAGRAAAVAVVLALATWNLTHQPPPVAKDGGYPAALTAAQRIGGSVGSMPGLIVSLPEFKAPDAYLYPLDRIGTAIEGRTADRAGIRALVVLCDDLFVDDCGGPAEDAAAGPQFQLADRFTPAPGRTISVFLSTAP